MLTIAFISLNSGNALSIKVEVADVAIDEMLIEGHLMSS